jgi:hypothetical protein
MLVLIPASVSLAAAGLLIASLPASAKPRHSARSAHAVVRHASAISHGVVVHHEAAMGITSERATEIQTALIKQGYLTGEPSGTWDSQTSSAMQKLQSDNGWQTRLTPDSRALIKLGLGPQNTTAAATTPTLSTPSQ